MMNAKEERFFLVLVDEVDSFVGEEISKVGALRVCHLRHGYEIIMFSHGNNCFIEPAFRGVMFALLAKMPFSK